MGVSECMVLRACYAKPSTELPYGGTRRGGGSVTARDHRTPRRDHDVGYGTGLSEAGASNGHERGSVTARERGSVTPRTRSTLAARYGHGY
eukprot:1529341-Rhodomonas_salina.1